MQLFLFNAALCGYVNIDVQLEWNPSNKSSLYKICKYTMKGMAVKILFCIWNICTFWSRNECCGLDFEDQTIHKAYEKSPQNAVPFNDVFNIFDILLSIQSVLVK